MTSSPARREEGPATHVHDGELGQDLVEALLERCLRELDLAHVYERTKEVSSQGVED